MSKPYATITLPTKEAADALGQALNHVFREVFDRELDGDGKHLDAALMQLRKAGVRV